MSELSAIITELETVASWHSGARRAKVTELVDRLREHAGEQTPDLAANEERTSPAF